MQKIRNFGRECAFGNKMGPMTKTENCGPSIYTLTIEPRPNPRLSGAARSIIGWVITVYRSLSIIVFTRYRLLSRTSLLTRKAAAFGGPFFSSWGCCGCRALLQRLRHESAPAISGLALAVYTVKTVAEPLLSISCSVLYTILIQHCAKNKLAYIQMEIC